MNYLITQNKVAEYTKENRNIILAEALAKDVVKVFLVEGNKVMYSQIYRLKDYTIEQLISELKGHILSYFSKEIQDLNIIDPEDIDEAHIIYSYLKKENKQCKHLVISDNFFNNSLIDKELENLIYNQL